MAAFNAFETDQEIAFNTRRGRHKHFLADVPGGATTTYIMKAYDDGLGQIVWWEATDQTATPAAGDTSPNYTGTLGTLLVIATK